MPQRVDGFVQKVDGPRVRYRFCEDPWELLDGRPDDGVYMLIRVEPCKHGKYDAHPFGPDCPMNPGCDCICPGTGVSE